MINLTIATLITIAAMALIVGYWIHFIFRETEYENTIRIEHTYDNANHCVMCDATIPEGTQVCPTCERKV